MAWVALLTRMVLDPSSAPAAVEVEALFRQYGDSQTTVTSPTVEVSGTFHNDQMKLSAGHTQDLVTSASADVRTFSSKGTIEEHRFEYNAAFEALIPDGTMAIAYIQSDENDYSSRIVSAGGTREFFQKNTVVSFGFANGDDRITSVSNLAFDESMKHQVYSLSLTQILSRNSLIQFIYDFRVENGFIASPYRRAKIIDTGSGHISSRPENHPRTRNRNAWAVRYNYYSAPLMSTLATTYRLYQDSWGVLSHTLEERITREFGKNIDISFALRFYTQAQATFYSDYYNDDPGPFYTGNNTLASYESYMASVRPSYRFKDGFTLYTKAEYFHQRFKNASDAGRLETLDDDKRLEISALVLGVGLSARF